MLLAGVCASCMDDLNIDKVTSDIDMNMGVVAPVVYADLTIANFADPQKYNAVKYYDTEYGKDLLRFKDDKEEMYNQTIFSLMKVNDGEEHIAQDIDLRESVASSDGEEVTVSLMFPVKNDYVTIKKVVTTLDINVTCDGSNGSEIEMSFPDGKKASFELPASQAIRTLSNVTIEVADDGYAYIPMTIIPKSSTANLGTLKTTFTFAEVQSIVATSATAVKSNVPEDEMSTGMHGLKRFEKTVDLQEPVIFLYSANTSNLDIEVSPIVKTYDKKREESLYVEPFTVKALAERQVDVFTKENCDIQYVFNYLPETLSVGADLLMTMPEGESEVEIRRSDYVIFGYGFDIPAHMKVKGTVEAERMNLHEVMDDLEYVEKARVLANSVSSFPAGAQMRIDFISKTTGEVFGEPIVVKLMGSPTLDENGLYVGETQAEIINELNKQQVQQLSESRELIFYIMLNEDIDEVPAIRLQKSNRLGVNLSLAAKFNMD